MYKLIEKTMYYGDPKTLSHHTKLHRLHVKQVLTYVPTSKYIHSTSPARYHCVTIPRLIVQGQVKQQFLLVSC